jgi:hypothetical protein
MKGINLILRTALAALMLGGAGVYLEPEACLAQTSYSYVSKESADKLDVESQIEFPVPFKPLPREITPCRACHGPEKDFPVNVKRKEDLLFHHNVQLKHGGVRVWCLDCHHPDNRNFLLPLSDGEPIAFEQSYKLCGKCHGTIFRDWRYGIHGKRTGDWNGKKQYYLCTNCHNPHTPRFKALEPKPAPNMPWTPKIRARKH